MAGLLTQVPSEVMAGVTGNSTDNGNGTYTYAYTLDNVGGLFDVVAFSLEFDVPGSALDWDPLDTSAGGDVIVPNGFWIAQEGIPTVGISAQDFLSIDPSGDVLTGGLLSGFSFVSAFAPGIIPYATFGASGESASGQTVGPTPTVVVPEGSTLIATGILGLGCAMIGMRRLSPTSRSAPMG